MKISKIILAALCLSLFSCSQEDVSTNPENPTSVNLKTQTLSQKDVDRLAKQFIEISASQLFIAKEQVIANFIDKMNHKIITDAKTASDVENWLQKNLNQTKFSTVKAGVDAFNNMTVVVHNFYAANEGFYNELHLGSIQQINIIFQPVLTVPGMPVQTTSDCDDACLGAYQDDLDYALDLWNRDMDFAAMPGNSVFRGNMEAAADWRFDCRLDNAEYNAWNCFDDCDQ